VSWFFWAIEVRSRLGYDITFDVYLLKNEITFKRRKKKNGVQTGDKRGSGILDRKSALGARRELD
jgi:hypothetical protein